MIRDLTIVVPAWNEARRIESTVETILAFAAKNLDRCELIVVDDGSTDGTADLVTRRFGDSVKVVVRPKRGGKGAAVRTGVMAARRQWTLFADADLSIPIDELAKLGAHASEDVPIVIGSKRAPGSDIDYPFVRRVLGRVGGLVVSVLVVSGFHDTQCGFKLYYTGVAKDLFRAGRIDGFGFDFELLYLARRYGHQVVEVPVRVDHRLGGTVRAGSYVSVLSEALRVWWNKVTGAYPP